MLPKIIITTHTFMQSLHYLSRFSNNPYFLKIIVYNVNILVNLQLRGKIFSNIKHFS
jgi:hypothetical protein